MWVLDFRLSIDVNREMFENFILESGCLVERLI